MINLVPTETRAKLTRFYRERLTVVFLISSLISFVFGAIFLVSPYLLAKEKTTSIERSIAISKALSAARMESNPEFQAKELSRRVDLIVNKNSAIPPGKVLEEILKSKPAKTSIDGLSYQNKGGEWTVEVRGMADDRKSLLDFVEVLESNTLFSKVNVPVSNFVQEKELPFNVTLTVNKINK